MTPWGALFSYPFISALSCLSTVSALLSGHLIRVSQGYRTIFSFFLLSFCLYYIIFFLICQEKFFKFFEKFFIFHVKGIAAKPSEKIHHQLRESPIGDFLLPNGGHFVHHGENAVGVSHFYHSLHKILFALGLGDFLEILKGFFRRQTATDTIIPIIVGKQSGLNFNQPSFIAISAPVADGINHGLLKGRRENVQAKVRIFFARSGKGREREDFKRNAIEDKQADELIHFGVGVSFHFGVSPFVFCDYIIAQI